MGFYQRTNGLATIMAIGTAVPPFVIQQADFPDYYFRLSGSDCEHLTSKFKDKFVRLCVRSEIEKRHMHLTEEILKENPSILSYGVPSLNIRRKLVASEVPKLAEEAASKAIEEWGQPRSKITHVVFSTVVSSSNPGEDVRMVELLGLDPSIKRVPLYQQGCYAGGTALRVAKDLAENNVGARVLVVCAESTISSFQGPSDDERNVMSQVLFGDGASAAIVGSDPIPSLERPLFEIVDTAVHIIPDSADLVTLDFLESGLILHVSEDVPSVISSNLEKALVQSFCPNHNIKDWNSLFWVTHPGGRKILDMIEANLRLTKDKLRASRKVLREYGNMIGACLLFILDDIRKSSINAGMSTTGEGKDEGIVLGFGPGLTVEAVILRAVSITYE